MKRWTLSSLLLALCAGCTAPYGETLIPRLEVEQAGATLDDHHHIKIPFGPPMEDATLTRLSLQNSGTADLVIKSVTIRGDAAETLRATLVRPGKDGTVTIKPGEERVWIAIERIAPDTKALPGTGELVIRTNRTMKGVVEHRRRIVPYRPRPALSTSPSAIAMGDVRMGEIAEKPLALLNTGTAPLSITALDLPNSRGFSLLVGDDSLVDSDDPGRVQLEPPLVIEAGALVSARVRFHAQSARPSVTDLLLFSPISPGGHKVPLSANTNAPCITVSPGALNFGGKIPGSTAVVEVDIRACGEAPLHLDEAGITGDAENAFAIRGLTREGAQATLPQVLGPNEGVRIALEFSPPRLSPRDPVTEQLSPFVGKLILATNASGRSTTVPLEGLGVEVECPTPIITIEEGYEVVPQTRLHLDGSQSFGPTPISGYTWSANQPEGATSTFFPSAAGAMVEFPVDAAGLYTFKLSVSGIGGETCGNEAVALVNVAPRGALHIELLWETPGDRTHGDDTWETGSDVDLHIVHPLAEGIDIDGDATPDGYFDEVFDCFWNNPQPIWGNGAMASEDDPRLDRDDTDGDGPENINLDAPQDGLAYKVGVHYWEDHGYGESLATLRVYISGTLRYEKAGVKMARGDLWDAVRVDWPSGQITEVQADSGEPVIHPGIFPEDQYLP